MTVEVRFFEQYCKGCSFCVHFCPKGIIALAPYTNDQGYNPATITDLSKCTGCGICALMCPHVVIEIVKGDAA